MSSLSDLAYYFRFMLMGNVWKKYVKLPKNVTGFPTVPWATSLTLIAVTSYTCKEHMHNNLSVYQDSLQ